MGNIGGMTRDYSLPPGEETARIEVPGDHAGLRLDQCLAKLLPEHSRARIQQWIADGRVTVEGWSASSANRRVGGGERISVTFADPAPAGPSAAEDIPLRIVHEDEAILVIDKPAGLVVHPGAGNASGTLLNALLAHAPVLAGLPRAGIVHRLDKDTSGLLVVAKTEQAQTSLVRQLQARDVNRAYYAALAGTLGADGTVDAPIGRHPVHRTRMAVVGRGKVARTRFRAIERGTGWTWAECRLDTGRTHQIRVHMAHIGFPLLGDPVYGPRRLPAGVAAALGGFARQALHAHRLGLLHPVSGRPSEWESPLPEDFAGLLTRLREEAPAC